MGTNDKMVVASSNSIEPTTLAELKALAKDAADSGFFGANNPAQAMMIMMAGKDLGFSYTQALRAFHVIKGKPSLSADGMVAVCLSHKDLCEYFKCTEETPQAVTWETKRTGQDPRKLRFTIEDAQKAGLTGSDMYKKFPARMLSARAKSFLARDTYPELVMGLYDPEELQAVPERSQARPTPAPAPVHVEAKPAPSQVVTDDGEVIDAEVIDAEVEPTVDMGELLTEIANWPKESKKLLAEKLKAIVPTLPKADGDALRTAYQARFA